jgi:FKBP-type peptidyl-prolyl cis-trans isomerase 2
MIKDGSFVLLDYVATIKETNDVFTSTREEEAKKADIYRAGEEYEPQLLVVGSGWFPKGLEEGLIGHDKGENFTVELTPEKAYGSRDPSKIRSYPIRKFRSKETRLQPGARVDIDGKLGVVRSIGAGRVQVDFNPPLSGKTLVYAVEIKDVVEEPTPRILALMHRRMPSVPVEKFNPRVSDGTVTIEIPNDVFLVEGLQIIKRAIFNDVTGFLPDVSAVVFIESYSKEKKGEKEPVEQKPLAEPAPQVEAPIQSAGAPAEEGAQAQ